MWWRIIMCDVWDFPAWNPAFNRGRQLSIQKSLACARASKLTRTTRTPAFWGYPPPPNDYPYHWVILDPKSKEDKVKITNLKNSPNFEFWNGHYTRHTIWSCLIRCANMKSDEYCWRYRVDTILSTDGQTDKVIPVYPPFNFVEAGGIITTNINVVVALGHNEW